ncbi:MAG TPA: M48 family metallopeptidase [Burkholderiales bacterium]|nr:M48 family metallopeptidase [Burkholderiales bacterium]
MHPFTWLFLVALAMTMALRLWLAQRHIRFVRENSAEVPAAFAEKIELASHRKAAAYTVDKTRLHMLDVLVSATLLLVFTLGGGINWLFDTWTGVFEAGGYAHGIAIIASVVFFTAVVDLPFAVYRSFVIEERYGFNRMTPRLFVLDLVKQTVIGAAIALPLLFVVLWLMQSMGSYWWLYVWLVWMSFNVLLLVLYPTLIAPLFNKFTPLADEILKQRVDALLARCGFRARGLFVMDGSRRSSHGNAYFTGLGAAKRIVFFDTLLERLTSSEIEAVLAHELGHFKHRHVFKRVALLFLMSFGFLALLGWLAQQSWFYTGLGVDGQNMALALLLFSLVLPVFSFLLQPLGSLYSRKHEYEADAYAAQQADASNLVSALVKLYQDNAATLTPDPVHSAFYDSHPPAALRIARLQSLAH